jgi:hypothetical protein
MRKTIFLILLKTSLISSLIASNNRCFSENTTKENPWSFFTSLLYWKANQEISSSWANNFLETTPYLIEQGFYDPNITYFNWNAGVRLGANYRFSSKDLEAKAYWTHYHTSSSQGALGLVLLSQFFEGFLSDEDAFAGKANWDFDYNMFNIELGKNFCFSNCLTFKPYIGVKGGFIKQKVNSSFIYLAPNLGRIGYESLTNNFYGIGPTIGLDTSWILANRCNNQIDLIGNFSFSTQWGNWCSSDVYYNDDTFVTSSISGIGHNPFGAISLTSLIGLNWQYCFYQNYTINLLAGWEMQYWVNQLRLPTFQILRLHGDLILQGLTLNCKIDF